MARIDIAASEFSAAAGEELLEALKDRWWYGQGAAGVLKAIWLPKVQEHDYALKDAPEEVKNDRGIVLAAVKQYGGALQYASEELMNDREIVIAAVKEDGGALESASEELKKDPDIKQACKK